MYASDTEFKQESGIKSDGDDALIEDCIARAQKIIERGTGHIFEATDDTTRKFDAIANIDGLTLHLDKRIAEITKITNGDGVEVASDEYTTLPRNATVDGKSIYAIKLLGSAGKSWTYDTDPENAISIDGKWAHSLTPPPDIKGATIALAIFFYRRKESHQDIDRPIRLPSGALLLPASYPNVVQEVINGYRKLIRAWAI